MAQKGADSVPFIHIDQASFLKRNWVRYDDYGYMCPLDKTSIAKMMCIGVASTSVDRLVQYASALKSASIEAFYHGRDFHECFRACVRDILVSEPELGVWLEDSVLLDYDAMWLMCHTKRMLGRRPNIEEIQEAIGNLVPSSVGE